MRENNKEKTETFKSPGTKACMIYQRCFFYGIDEEGG